MGRTAALNLSHPWDPRRQRSGHDQRKDCLALPSDPSGPLILPRADAGRSMEETAQTALHTSVRAGAHPHRPCDRNLKKRAVGK